MTNQVSVVVNDSSLPTVVEVSAPGPQGIAGPTGPAGIGAAWQQGAGVPGSGVGSNGDFYLNTSNGNVYGPKASGAWGSIIFNIAQGQQGPAGPQGSTGQTGPAGSIGPAGPQGSTGATGAAGSAGAAGAAGAAGTNGRTILNGSGAPGSGAGSDGDFYIDTTASKLYGPKASGAWGSGTSLVGVAGSSGIDGREVQFRSSGGYVQWRYSGETSWTNLIALTEITGPQGNAGATGASGAAGRTVLSGSSAPGSGTGSDGDFFIDTTNTRIYGPKASGAWGSGTSLVGAAGATGSAGAAGSTGATGAAATIAVGTVTTGAAGSSAAVTNAGTSSAASFNFTIPRGDTGATGATGATGSTGPGGVVVATAPITYNSGTQTVAITAATTSAAGSMSSADKTKLDSVASGATANSSDATLLARANHTGTQAFSTLTGAPIEIGIACSDETTNLTTGTAKVTFRMPCAVTLTAVRLNVNTAPTGSALVVNVLQGGSSVFSTKPQIDAGTKTSVGSGTATVISTSALTSDAEITINLDQIGSTIAGKGLKVWLIGTRA